MNCFFFVFRALCFVQFILHWSLSVHVIVVCSLCRWFAFASYVARFYLHLVLFTRLRRVKRHRIWSSSLSVQLLLYRLSLILHHSSLYRQCPLGMQRKSLLNLLSLYSCIAFRMLLLLAHQTSSVSLCQKLLATGRRERASVFDDAVESEKKEEEEEEEKNGQKSRSLSSKLLLCKFYFQPLNKVDKFYSRTSLSFVASHPSSTFKWGVIQAICYQLQKRQDNCALFLMASPSDFSRLRRRFFVSSSPLLISHSSCFLLIELVSLYRLRRHINSIYFCYSCFTLSPVKYGPHSSWEEKKKKVSVKFVPEMREAS